MSTEPSVKLVVETSISYSSSGITVLAGAVKLNPNVTRQVNVVGANGEVPLGPVPLTKVGAGIRYQWKQSGKSWTLRLDALNLTDAQGLHVSSLGVVLPEQRRRFAATLAADF